MHRPLLITLIALAIAGCQASPGSSTSAAHSSSSASGTEAVTASAPRSIDELTNQTQVWECPKCGMDYDRAGVCEMDSTALVETRVSYICPADNKPVEHSGKCPRCAANARVEKTAMAAELPGAASGK
jgi:rubrerythrin